MLYTISCKECNAVNVVNVNEEVIDKTIDRVKDDIFGHEILEITEKVIEPKNCWRC